MVDRGTMTERAEAVMNERDRCARVAEGLAKKWEASAAQMRADYTRRPIWFGKPYVLPMREHDAKTIDAAASGLRAVARLIREGADVPR